MGRKINDPLELVLDLEEQTLKFYGQAGKRLEYFGAFWPTVACDFSINGRVGKRLLQPSEELKLKTAKLTFRVFRPEYK